MGMCNRTTTMFAVGAFALAVSASVAAQNRSQDVPANFVAWREGLASSAQPNKAYLERAKELKYEIVINLAPPQSEGSIATEAAIVGARGVRYVNIPVDFEKPTAEDFRFFSDVMKASAGQSVLVHCQANLRGSSFVFLYRVIHEGAPAPATVGKLTGIWMPNAVWKKFIDDTLAAHGKKVEIL
jgi:protein tyrosine phosphatase (PTP) superfamily phosphohydrolase (DUF442 family)